jgi:hypothetical protein
VHCVAAPPSEVSKDATQGETDSRVVGPPSIYLNDMPPWSNYIKLNRKWQIGKTRLSSALHEPCLLRLPTLAISISETMREVPSNQAQVLGSFSPAPP